VIITKRTNEEWLELYKTQIASGESRVEWCKRNEIKEGTMSEAVKRLRKKGLLAPHVMSKNKHGLEINRKTQENKKWFEVKPLPECANSSYEANHQTQAQSQNSINLGNYKIELPENFCEKTLVRVCTVLGRLC